MICFGDIWLDFTVGEIYVFDEIVGSYEIGQVVPGYARKRLRCQKTLNELQLSSQVGHGGFGKNIQDNAHQVIAFQDLRVPELVLLIKLFHGLIDQLGALDDHLELMDRRFQQGQVFEVIYALLVGLEGGALHVYDINRFDIFWLLSLAVFLACVPLQNFFSIFLVWFEIIIVLVLLALILIHAAVVPVCGVIVILLHLFLELLVDMLNGQVVEAKLGLHLEVLWLLVDQLGQLRLKLLLVLFEHDLEVFDHQAVHLLLKQVADDQVPHVFRRDELPHDVILILHDVVVLEDRLQDQHHEFIDFFHHLRVEVLDLLECDLLAQVEVEPLLVVVNKNLPEVFYDAPDHIVFLLQLSLQNVRQPLEIPDHLHAILELVSRVVELGVEEHRFLQEEHALVVVAGIGCVHLV